MSAKPLTASTGSEAAWVKLMPSRHFIAVEDRRRRCLMCRKLINSGERYFASRTVDYGGIVRFHASCAEEYAEKIYS